MNSLPLLVTSESREIVVRRMANELRLESTEREHALQLFRRKLPPLATPECLAFLFGVSPKLIAAMSGDSSVYYRQFALPKRDGSARLIATPRRFLKLVQRWILGNILSRAEVSDRAMGFVKGKSAQDHAARHNHSQNVICVDIKDFFPSISPSQVRATFQSLAFPERVASQLTGLCCWRGQLPQGAPTSPALSNIVFLPADDALAALAQEWNAEYSRYADDLVFSGNKRFSGEDVAAIASVIHKHGFKINASKTRIQGKGSRKVVTGFVINERVQPPRPLRKRWRALFHQANRSPKDFMSRLAEMRGICSYLEQSNPREALEYRAVLERLETA